MSSNRAKIALLESIEASVLLFVPSSYHAVCQLPVPLEAFDSNAVPDLKISIIFTIFEFHMNTSTDSVRCSPFRKIYQQRSFSFSKLRLLCLSSYKEMKEVLQFRIGTLD